MTCLSCLYYTPLSSFALLGAILWAMWIILQLYAVIPRLLLRQGMELLTHDLAAIKSWYLK